MDTENDAEEVAVKAAQADLVVTLAALRAAHPDVGFMLVAVGLDGRAPAGVVTNLADNADLATVSGGVARMAREGLGVVKAVPQRH